MTYERTAVPNPPVGAGGEQPQVQKTNDSITDVTQEIKSSQVETREHDADRPSSGGPSPDPEYAARMEKLRRKMERVNDPNYLPTITMNELYENVYQSRPPVIDGLLRTGTYLMAGAPKVGKSFLVAQIAYHVSTGKPLWGYNVRQGTVLYLALEDDYQRLQERMSRMFGVEGTDDFHFTVWAKPLSDGLPEQLDGFLQEHPDTRLVIIDTLQKIRETTGENYSYASDYDVIGKLKQFSDTKCVCLLIVHHTRKQQATDQFDMISGTNGLLGAADGAFLLMKESRNSNAAVLEVTGRDQQEQKLHLIRDEASLVWNLDRVETDLWKEPEDPILLQVAGLLTAENSTWEGRASDLGAVLKTDLQPNMLTRKLNVSRGKLSDQYHVQYDVKRNKNGSFITLTLTV